MHSFMCIFDVYFLDKEERKYRKHISV